MKNYLKIINFLLDNRKESFSINQIAKSLSMNYRTAFEEIKKLETEQTIKIKKIANSNQCTLNSTLSPKIFEAEHLRTENLLKNKNIKVLSRHLDNLNRMFFISLIFGSHAKQQINNNSDIDLCIITDDNEFKAQAEQTARILPLSIHFFGFTSKEFMSMLETAKPNVGKEIANSNIILSGIEEFYKLIQCSTRNG
ncbi:MAG: nucleotidyltransferase domain-containing protein [Candidatus Woesearchaeota archaeon]